MIFNFIHEGRSDVDVEYWSRLVAVYRYKCYQRPDGTVDYSRGGRRILPNLEILSNDAYG